MHNTQSAHGKKNLRLIICVLFSVSTMGFIMVFMNETGNEEEDQPNVTRSAPPASCVCPPCSPNVIIIPKRDGKYPYVPRPLVKRSQDELMEKLRRHELSLEKGVMDKMFWPWHLHETTHECTMGEDRIGFPGEGGKWICGMNNLLQKPKCVIYSMGSNGQHDFEDDLLANTQCEIHTFDMDDFSKVFNGTRVHFHKSKIGDGKDGTQSITYWMNALGHKYLDVLKIDIESGEYSTFENLVKQYPLPWIGQILIEIHLMGSHFPALSKEQKYQQIDKTLRLVDNIHTLGLVQFHREANPRGGVAEYCFGNLRPRPPV